MGKEELGKGGGTGSLSAADRIQVGRRDRELTGCRLCTGREERQEANQRQTGYR